MAQWLHLWGYQGYSNSIRSLPGLLNKLFQYAALAGQRKLARVTVIFYSPRAAPHLLAQSPFGAIRRFFVANSKESVLNFMRLLLALLLPFSVFLTIGRPFAGLLCLILQVTLIGWVPAAIWAVYALSQYNTDKKIQKALNNRYL